MIKITFMGAGSFVFAKNILGDCMLSDALHDCHIALYDIDEKRMNESYEMISCVNENCNQARAKITQYAGIERRKDALRDADFVVNAIQVGGYDPCTVLDFEIPKKYGLRQTIGDTLGIGGIFRGLRTIRVMRDFAEDMEQVCPNAWLLNYSNPMAIITGYMLRHTRVRTVGLCHSVQVCTRTLFDELGIKEYPAKELIAGINHMAWLLDIRDAKGNDLYPMVRELARKKSQNEKHHDMVRFEYIRRLGYYCTESSEHNAEYNPFFIKAKQPELIERYNIPLDEYPRRCISHIKEWDDRRNQIMQGGKITHERTGEYGSYIMEAMVTGKVYKIGGNVLNQGAIPNLPPEACVEVPCYVDREGVHASFVGRLPVQLAAMNQTNINPQLLTIEAAATGKREHVYHAAMLDPHTAAELNLDEIVSLCDELLKAHADAGFPCL